MGPLIPNGLIPIEWNFVIALLIGLAFGYIMEASGFSSSRKIIGVFYGYDFAVIKLFFTTAIVSAIGLYYMDYLGWVDISQLYVHPTYLWPAIVGGVFMGLGFMFGGYCPGTSLCAIGIGKIDALAFAVGIMIGVFIFSESFGLLEPFFNGSNYGHITMMDTFGISPYWIILIFTVIAVIVFYFSDFIRKRVKKVFY